jgi:hypothetical protein
MPATTLAMRVPIVADAFPEALALVAVVVKLSAIKLWIFAAHAG